MSITSQPTDLQRAARRCGGTSGPTRGCRAPRRSAREPALGQRPGAERRRVARHDLRSERLAHAAADARHAHHQPAAPCAMTPPSERSRKVAGRKGGTSGCDGFRDACAGVTPAPARASSSRITSPPHRLPPLAAATRFPVRLKMAALAGAAVVLTLGVMLLPTYARVRSALARAQGERLVYLARATALGIPGDSSLAGAARARADPPRSRRQRGRPRRRQRSARDRARRRATRRAASISPPTATASRCPTAHGRPPTGSPRRVAAGRAGATGHLRLRARPRAQRRGARSSPISASSARSSSPAAPTG